MPGSPSQPPLDTRHAPAWAGVGLVLAAYAALAGPAMTAGGVAPFVTAALVGLALGLPVAAAEARARRPLTAAQADIARSALACAAGAAIALGVLPPAGEPAWAAGAWVAAVALLVGVLARRADASSDPRGRRRATWALAALAVGGGALALLHAPLRLLAAGVPPTPPWAVLEPGWGTVDRWLPHALVLGLALPLAGARAGAIPGEASRHTRRPALTAGLGLLLVTGLLVADAVGLESVASATPGGLPPVWNVALLLPVAAGITHRAGSGGHLRALAEVGAWTLWFWLVGPPAALWVWLLLAPAVVAGRLAEQALASQGVERLGAALAAVVAAAAAVLGFPGVPDAPAHAFGAAATVVILVWRVGWRRLQEAP